MFNGKNVIVLDLEVANSPDELPTGWEDKRALGLSIGGYYSYLDDCIVWFDAHTLYETIDRLLVLQPLIVSFNGIGFDSQVMIDCVDDGPDMRSSIGLVPRHAAMEYGWKLLWKQSYDILAEIWAEYGRRYEKGLNSLDALLEANGLGRKTGHGAHAPKLWQQGKIAEVLNYCQNDILRTKDLFELICTQEGRLRRSTGEIYIPYIAAHSINPADWKRITAAGDWPLPTSTEPT